MSDLLNALRAAVVMAELDLGELDEMYSGVKLPYRTNWTRGQRKERARLLNEIADLLERQQRYISTEPKETLAERMAEIEAEGERNQAGWLAWWAEVLQMTPDEVATLQDALPRPHWQWIADQIVTRQNEYEAAELKKVRGGRSHTSEAEANSRLTSIKESGSPTT